MSIIKPIPNSHDSSHDAIVKKFYGDIKITSPDGSTYILKEGQQGYSTREGESILEKGAHGFLLSDGSKIETYSDSGVMIQFLDKTHNECVIRENNFVTIANSGVVNQQKVEDEETLKDEVIRLNGDHNQDTEGKLHTVPHYEVPDKDSDFKSIDCKCPPQQPEPTQQTRQEIDEKFLEDEGNELLAILNQSDLRGLINAGWLSDTFTVAFENNEFITRIIPREDVPPIGQPNPPSINPNPPTPPTPPVPPEPSLSIVKTADNLTPCVCDCGNKGDDHQQDDNCSGNIVNFVITVTQGGDGEFMNVEVTDEFLNSLNIPPFLELVGFNPSEGVFNPDSGIWSGINLNFDGDSATLTLQVKVISPIIEHGSGTIEAVQQDPSLWTNAVISGYDFNPVTPPVAPDGPENLNIDFSSSRGIGVSAGPFPGDQIGAAPPEQINNNPYGPADFGSEQLSMKLTDGTSPTPQTLTATWAQITVSNLFLDENDGEYGKVTAYDADGNQLGSVIFGNLQFGLMAGETFIDGSVFRPVTYNTMVDTNNVGSFIVTDQDFGGRFSHLVFEAVGYGINDLINHIPNPLSGPSGDSSDYFIRHIEYKTITCPPDFQNVATITSPDLGIEGKSPIITPLSPDLSILKTVDVSQIDPNCPPTNGDCLTFDIIVQNNGCDPATSIVVTDLLSAGYDFVSASDIEGISAEVTQVGDQVKVVWTLPPGFELAPGESFTLHLTAKIDLTEPGVDLSNLSNTATVSSECDANSINNSYTDYFDPGDADLCIDKSVDNPYPSACGCEEVKFTIDVQNKGENRACDVKVVDCLPDGLDFKDICGLPEGATYTIDGNKITIYLGDLEAGEQVSFNIKAKVDVDTTKTTTVTGDTVADWSSLSPTAYKYGDPNDPADDNGTFIYGDNTAPFVPNVNQPQTGMLFVGVDGLGVINDVNDVNVNGPQANEVGHNPAFQTKTEGIVLHFTGTDYANPTNPMGVFKADIELAKFFPNEGGGLGEYGVISAYDVNGDYITSIFFGESQNGIGPGSTLMYQGELINFVDVNFTDIGAGIGSLTVTSGDFNNTNFGSLAFFALPYGTDSPPNPNQTDSSDYYIKSVTYTEAICPDPLVNKVEVSSDTFDPNLNNNHDTAVVTPQSADLSINKEIISDQNDDCCPPTDGDKVLFKITITNNGCGTAKDIKITDCLPEGLCLVWATDGYQVDDGKIEWSFDHLNEGESITLYLKAEIDLDKVDKSDLESLTNTAKVESECDPNPYNNVDTSTIDPGDADLAICKTATVDCCDEVKYTIKVTNYGNDTACDVKVIDCLPDNVNLDQVCLPDIPGISYHIEGDKVIVTLDKLAAGDSFSFDIKATIQPVDDGPIAFYSGDKTADDFVAHNDGTYNGAYGPGHNPPTSGPAFAIDSINGVTIQDPTNTLDTQYVSIAAWVSHDSNPGNFKYIVSNGGDDTAAGYALYTGTNGGLQFYVYDGSGLVDAPNLIKTPDFGSSIWDGNYHFVVATYDGVNVSLYVDGSLYGQTSTAGFAGINYNLPDTYSHIGEFNETTNQDLNFAGGLIDDVKIFDHALSAGEIANLYNGIDHGEKIINKAEVTSDTYDPCLDNNTDKAKIEFKQADLALVKTICNLDPCCPPSDGDKVTFNIEIRNIGNETATNISVADLLGKGFDFYSASDGGMFDGFDGDAEKIVWTINELGAGQIINLKLEAIVDLKDGDGNIDLQQICNSATVSSECDANLINNADAVCLNPGDADLAICKTANIENCDEVKFNIKVTNNGNDTACDVIVTDCLPDNVNLDQVCLPDIPGISYHIEGDKVIVTLDKLAAGDSFSFDIKATIQPSDDGPIAFYSGDKTADDFVADNNGTYNGAYTPGHNPPTSGAAFAIDSINGVTIQDPTGALDVSLVSIAAWVSHDNPGNFKYIVSNGGDGNAANYALYTGIDGGLHFYIYDGSNDTTPPHLIQANFGNSVWDGNYHLVVGTYDGVNVSLYVDGVLEGQTSALGFAGFNYSEPGSDPFAHIGEFNETTNQDLNFAGGKIDDVKFFDHALSAEEVANLYHGIDPGEKIMDEAEPSDTYDPEH